MRPPVSQFLPSSQSLRRWGLPLVAAAMLSACGGGGGQPGNSVAMTDLEKADGTTADAMTDLDGVRAEGTALVETGNAAPAGGKGAGAGSADKADADAARNDEVVAEQ
jgi:hypothetical protein